MSFSDEYENKVLNLLFNRVGFTMGFFYIGLADSTVDSSTGANCGEVNMATSPDYTRLVLSTAYWTTSTAGQITNALTIVWPLTLTDWGTITHFVIFNASIVGTGDIVVYGLLDPSWALAIGSEPRFDIGDIEINLD